MAKNRIIYVIHPSDRLCMMLWVMLPLMYAVRMREQFEVYSNGLFSVPIAIPGTPYGKAINARKIILDDIERELSLHMHPCAVA